MRDGRIAGRRGSRGWKTCTMKVLGSRHAVINACGDAKVVVVMDRWRKATGKIVSESNEAL